MHGKDENRFRLNVMSTCGRCHQQIAETYFDTYHGKVSKLGYTKAAKCYDCHGAHDVLAVADPRSHLSRANVRPPAGSAIPPQPPPPPDTSPTPRPPIQQTLRS